MNNILIRLAEVPRYEHDNIATSDMSDSVQIGLCCLPLIIVIGVAFNIAEQLSVRHL